APARPSSSSPPPATTRSRRSAAATGAQTPAVRRTACLVPRIGRRGCEQSRSPKILGLFSDASSKRQVISRRMMYPQLPEASSPWHQHAALILHYFCLFPCVFCQQDFLFQEEIAMQLRKVFTALCVGSFALLSLIPQPTEARPPQSSNSYHG